MTIMATWDSRVKLKVASWAKLGKEMKLRISAPNLLKNVLWGLKWHRRKFLAKIPSDFWENHFSWCARPRFEKTGSHTLPHTHALLAKTTGIRLTLLQCPVRKGPPRPTSPIFKEIKSFCIHWQTRRSWGVTRRVRHKTPLNVHKHDVSTWLPQPFSSMQQKKKMPTFYLLVLFLELLVSGRCGALSRRSCGNVTFGVDVFVLMYQVFMYQARRI